MERKRSNPQPLCTILQYTCLTIKLFYCKFIHLLTFIEVKTIIFFAKMVCSPFTLFEVYGHTLSGWTSVVNRQSSCHLKKMNMWGRKILQWNLFKTDMILKLHWSAIDQVSQKKYSSLNVYFEKKCYLKSFFFLFFIWKRKV